MAERRPTMMDPPIEALLDRVDSKYTLVSLAAKRGREVNSYFNQLGEGAAGKITYHRIIDPDAPEVEEVLEDVPAV